MSDEAPPKLREPSKMFKLTRFGVFAVPSQLVKLRLNGERRARVLWNFFFAIIAFLRTMERVLESSKDDGRVLKMIPILDYLTQCGCGWVWVREKACGWACECVRTEKVGWERERRGWQNYDRGCLSSRDYKVVGTWLKSHLLFFGARARESFLLGSWPSTSSPSFFPLSVVIVVLTIVDVVIVVTWSAVDVVQSFWPSQDDQTKPKCQKKRIIQLQ